jgi:5-methylcytosine-specific restriction endonuclease McrA
MSEKKIINNFETRETIIITRGEARVYSPIKPKKRKNPAHYQKPPKQKHFVFCSNSTCKRKYQPKSAAFSGHVGYCSKSCMSGIRRFRGTPKQNKAFRRRTRQLRRQDKKTSPPSFYESDAWRNLRFAALRKYGFECMACGRSKRVHGVVIHVDHIKPRSKFPELELTLSNLQVLCEDCNLGKSNLSQDDLRPSS